MDINFPKYSLTRLIVETLGIEYRSAQFYDVFSISLLYVANVDNSYTYQRKLKQNVDFSSLSLSAQGFRLKLIGYRACSLNLRFFLHNVARMRSYTSDDIRELAVSFRMARSDTRAAYQLLRNNPEFRSTLRRSPVIREVPAHCITVSAFRRLEERFADIYTPVIKYVKHISYSKLRFISTSTNTDLSDLHGDLMLRAVQAFMSRMPGDYTQLHLANYIKRAVHNHAINMIHAATAEKRSRLVSGTVDGIGEGFMLRCASENQLNANAEDGETIGYDELMSDEFISNEIAARDTQLAVEQLMSRYANRPKKLRFLTLLSGQYCPEFTEYLRSNRKLRSQNHDNVDLQELTSNSRYIGHVCEYLSVNKKQATRFLRRVGTRHFPGGLQ